MDKTICYTSSPIPNPHDATSTNLACRCQCTKESAHQEWVIIGSIRQSYDQHIQTKHVISKAEYYIIKNKHS